MTVFILILVFLYGPYHTESRGPVKTFATIEDCEFVGRQEQIAAGLNPNIRNLAWHCDEVRFTEPPATQPG